MCQSKFILCPGGDAPWSFRFYETLMCQSIPIVESWHHTYRTPEESIIKYEYILINNMNNIMNISYDNMIKQNNLLFEQYHLLHE